MLAALSLQKLTNKRDSLTFLFLCQMQYMEGLTKTTTLFSCTFCGEIWKTHKMLWDWQRKVEMMNSDPVLIEIGAEALIIFSDNWIRFHITHSNSAPIRNS